MLIKDLPSAVVHLEALGDYLLVFTTDGIVREYKVSVSLQNIDPLANSRKPSLPFFLSFFFSIQK